MKNNNEPHGSYGKFIPTIGSEYECCIDDIDGGVWAKVTIINDCDDGFVCQLREIIDNKCMIAQIVNKRVMRFGCATVVIKKDKMFRGIVSRTEVINRMHDIASNGCIEDHLKIKLACENLYDAGYRVESK